MKRNFENMNKERKPLKEKKCKGCGQKFAPKTSLQYLCPKYECFKLYDEIRFKKKCQSEKKEYYQKNKKISEYKEEARKVFQLFIRLRDKEQPCISCNCKTAKQWDGGHFLKAELFSGLIFVEENCHKQCSVCNDYKSGNELEYRDGLIARYGINYVETLEATKNDNRQYKYTKQELIDIKNYYSLKVKEAQNG